MKNYQIYEIKERWQELKALSGNKGYYVPMVKNIKKIDIEIEAFELIKQELPEVKEFLSNKQAILEELSNKDKDGKPVKTVEKEGDKSFVKYDIPEDKEEELKIKNKELIEKYKDVIEQMVEKEKKYFEALEEDCTINFVKIKESDLPTEMTPELYELIIDFVDETT